MKLYDDEMADGVAQEEEEGEGGKGRGREEGSTPFIPPSYMIIWRVIYKNVGGE